MRRGRSWTGDATPHRWGAVPAPEHLGAIVHGPVVLARSTGIVAGLRAIFAHDGGLWLPVVVRAEGVQGQAANRRHFTHGEPSPGGWSQPELVVEVDDESGLADASSSEGSGGEEDFEFQPHYWIDAIPADSRLVLTIGWPEAGLAPARSELTLDLDGYRDRIVRLL